MGNLSSLKDKMLWSLKWTVRNLFLTLWHHTNTVLLPLPAVSRKTGSAGCVDQNLNETHDSITLIYCYSINL